MIRFIASIVTCGMEKNGWKRMDGKEWMENIINNQLKYLSVLLLVVLLAGCRTGDEPVVDIPGFYSWDEITKEDKEDTGYGLYTYYLGQSIGYFIIS